ncbi:ribulose bisphosphate carboxylase small subunit [Leptolyngbya sp. PCC 6406]|uniref:ribulose bisphosphate carboxylase small subunit n=1 Tax=Leptolyngbya sp. PCC 6406 TaxID=1173264 RepID=UPI001CEDE3AB|nr:ribulose bisphosphate carboxylase small subunit [Leptolyngbya sp. PCC 6406]
MAAPKVDASAKVHPFSQLTGDVNIGPQVTVAPGVSVQAEAESSCLIGAGTQLEAGVTIQGLAAGRVLGDDDQPYSIWIGSQVWLAHKAVVHGPAYVGDDCFVGFHSTIFSARIGPGCVVMMHALIQDVEIPAGKFVPSGSVINQQSQADALADVQPEDWALVQEITHTFLGSADIGTTGSAPVPPPNFSSSPSVHSHSSQDNGSRTMQPQRLTSDIVQQVRQLLSQGYRIGTEHADTRRFRSNVWQTCSPLQSTREPEVLAALEGCLEEHTGEYVRMFGIDPVAKRRVATLTIQRPDGKPVTVSKTATVAASSPTSSYSHYSASPGSSHLSAEALQQVRSFLQQGYGVGTEHADTRRFRSNVWQTCTPIAATREAEVISALEACMRDHAGEYVRLYGIDPAAKKRLAPMTIQRPNDKPMAAGSGAVGRSAAAAGGGYGSFSSGGLSQEMVQQIRSIVSQGHRIGAEHADARRFRSNVWQTCAPIEATQEGAAIAAVEQCIRSHPGEYVRIYGIDPVAKQRHNPITVQRPDGKPAAASAPSVPINAGYQNGNARNSSYPSQNGAAGPLGGEVVQQVQHLVGQGYRISLEHADVRRYRSGAWQNGGVIEGRGAAEVLAALERSLGAHHGEYVRLIGIDPQAKRRVLETTIQRP